MLAEYFAYFLPDFHPWRHDNRALVRAVEQSLAAGHGERVPA